MNCTIVIRKMEESDMWYAETDDVPGLVLSSGSYDALLEKVRLLAPDLLELNCSYTGPVHFRFLTDHRETIRAHMAQ